MIGLQQLNTNTLNLHSPTISQGIQVCTKALSLSHRCCLSSIFSKQVFTFDHLFSPPPTPPPPNPSLFLFSLSLSPLLSLSLSFSLSVSVCLSVRWEASVCLSVKWEAETWQTVPYRLVAWLCVWASVNSGAGRAVRLLLNHSTLRDTCHWVSTGQITAQPQHIAWHLSLSQHRSDYCSATAHCMAPVTESAQVRLLLSHSTLPDTLSPLAALLKPLHPSHFNSKD